MRSNLHWIKFRDHFGSLSDFQSVQQEEDDEKRLKVAKKKPKKGSHSLRDSADWIYNLSLYSEKNQNEFPHHLAMIVTAGELFRFLVGHSQPKYRVVVEGGHAFLISKIVDRFQPLNHYYEEEKHQQQPFIEGLGRVIFAKYLLLDDDPHMQNLGTNGVYAIGLDHDRTFWPLAYHYCEQYLDTLYKGIYFSLMEQLELQLKNKKEDSILVDLILHFRKVLWEGKISYAEFINSPILENNPYLEKNKLIEFLKIISEKFKCPIEDALFTPIKKSAQTLKMIPGFIIKRRDGTQAMLALPANSIGKRCLLDYQNFPVTDQGHAANNWNFHYHFKVALLKEHGTFQVEKHFVLLKFLVNDYLWENILNRVYQEFSDQSALLRCLHKKDLFKEHLAFLKKQLRDTHFELLDIAKNDPAFRQFLEKYALSIGFVLLYENHQFFVMNKHHLSDSKREATLERLVCAMHLVSSLNNVFDDFKLPWNNRGLIQFEKSLVTRQSTPALKLVAKFYEETKQLTLAEACHQTIAHREEPLLFPIAMRSTLKKMKDKKNLSDFLLFKSPKTMMDKERPGLKAIKNSSILVNKFLGV